MCIFEINPTYLLHRSTIMLYQYILYINNDLYIHVAKLIQEDIKERPALSLTPFGTPLNIMYQTTFLIAQRQNIIIDDITIKTNVI